MQNISIVIKLYLNYFLSLQKSHRAACFYMKVGGLYFYNGNMAFRLNKKDLVYPPIYPKATRKLPTAKDKGWTKVDGFTLRDKIDFMPQPGLQENLCACECNLVFICGAATSGKTYGMYLTSLYGMDKPGFTAILFSYREKDSKKGSSIFRDGVEVLGNYNGCEYAASDNISFRFPQSNSQLQLANFNYNINNPSEWSDFKEDMKKKQASLIMVDEMTKMDEKAMLYLFSRNRDSSGMSPQFIGSFNPEYEHFSREVIQSAGFLDETWHVKKEMEGKVRYFFMKGKTFNEAVWGDTPEEVAERAGIVISERDKAAGMKATDMVKSFTVFTGEAADNRMLVAATGGQSVANLYAVGSEQSMILKGAYFGPLLSEELSVNRQMVCQLWENPISEDENMYATMDISSGKAENDKCPMIIWRGLQLVDISLFSGLPSELEGWIQTRLDRYGVEVERFAFDATGHGYWVQAFTSGIPVTWNKQVMKEYDASGNQVSTDEFYNLRSQLLGKTEVLLKKGLLSCTIPQDKLIPYGHKNEYRKFIDILFDEINLFVSLKKNGKTYYRSTDEFKAKFKFSPDIMTTIALRSVFELDTRERKKPAKQVPYNAYYNLYRRPEIKGRLNFYKR